MPELSYSSVSTVLHSWELARQRHAGEEEVGSEILIRLFQIEPETLLVYGFDEGMMKDHDKKAIRMKTLKQGKRIVSMLDSVFVMLGPDIDMLEDMFEHLAERHLRFGVKPHHFTALAKAVRLAMEDILGDEWTRKTGEAFEEVFGSLATSMKDAMLKVM